MTRRAVTGLTVVVAFAAVAVAPMAAAAAPRSGVWRGKAPAPAGPPVSFRVTSGAVLHFRVSGPVLWTCVAATPGMYLPTVAVARLTRRANHYRFRGSQTAVGPLGIATVLSVQGTYSSAHRASGTLVATRSGCSALRARWTATGPLRSKRLPGSGCGRECGPDGILDTPDDPMPLLPSPL